MSASFAAPSTGGAVSLILIVPFSIRAISFFEARGWILTERVIGSPPSLSLGGLFLDFFTGLLEAYHFQVHLHHLLEVLKKMVFTPFEVYDVCF